MFCSNCGTKNHDGDRFCTGCGQKLAIPSRPESTAPSPGESASPPESAPHPVKTEPATNRPAGKNKRIPKILPWCLAGVALATIVLLGLLFSLFGGETEEGDEGSFSKMKAEKRVSASSVGTILQKAKRAHEAGNVDLCGFYVGMDRSDAETLVKHYRLADDEYSFIGDPVWGFGFSLKGIRRLTNGGDTKEELFQSVANRVGDFKRDRNGMYHYQTVDGFHVSMSEALGLVRMEEKTGRTRNRAREKSVSTASPRDVKDLIAGMVRIPGKPFLMGRFEVTQAQWAAVMGNNPSGFADAGCPVENVSWDDCRTFLERLNALPEAKASGMTFRLPTDEEWEYACRAGATGDDYCRLGDGTDVPFESLKTVAWVSISWLGGGVDEFNTHRVGRKKPNAFGLYDMIGNVWEWTLTEGKRNDNGKTFVVRGGCYAGLNSDGPNIIRMTCSPSEWTKCGLRLCAETEADRRTREAEHGKVLSGIVSGMVPIPGKHYRIGKFEVTQAQWEAVTGYNPSEVAGPNLPVANVSWNDCQAFLEKLNALPVVKKSGLTFRMPTEKEWLFAGRAGATGKYCKMSDGTEITESTLDQVVWMGDRTIHPVGRKKPNAFGLHDMFGNVSEWTSTRGNGRPDGYVYCGGTWASGYGLYTHQAEPSRQDNDRGFRLYAENEADRQARDAELKAELKAKREKAIASILADMVPIPDMHCRIGKYEVTQAQWEAVTGENPSKFKGADHPVENVSWDDCQVFLEKLNALPVVKTSGLTFRLPTDNEWKMACRADANHDRGDTSWWPGNSGEKTHPVGQKKANASGLFDMYGNVREWTATANQEKRVVLGGSIYSWNNDDRDESPSCRSDDIGFRLYANTQEDRQADRQARESSRRKAVSEILAGMVQIHGKNYRLGKCEVTQSQWEALMGENPSAFKGANRPVENVSWNDCQSFLRKLNALPDVRKSGLVFRLPRDDEWEFACRAGSTGRWCRLSDGSEVQWDRSPSLYDVAWYYEDAWREGGTHPVGQKKANAFGLYDMHGNVEEWTSSSHGGDERLVCGGTVYDAAGYCAASERRSYSSSSRHNTLGFRLCASGAVSDEEHTSKLRGRDRDTRRPDEPTRGRRERAHAIAPVADAEKQTSAGSSVDASDASGTSAPEPPKPKKRKVFKGTDPSKNERGGAAGLAIAYYDTSSSSFSTYSAMTSFFSSRTPTLEASTIDFGDTLDSAITGMSSYDVSRISNKGFRSFYSTTGASSGRLHRKYANSSQNSFCAHVSGSIYLATAGTYSFGLAGDDGAVLYIDGTKVCSATWGSEGTGTIALTAGDHDLDLAFYEGSGGQGFLVQWKCPGDSVWSPLPQNVLSH